MADKNVCGEVTGSTPGWGQSCAHEGKAQLSLKKPSERGGRWVDGLRPGPIVSAEFARRCQGRRESAGPQAGRYRRNLKAIEAFDASGRPSVVQLLDGGAQFAGGSPAI
jgi:hypothetical protein